MSTVALISATCHAALAGIYNPPSLLLTLYFLPLRQVPQQVPILREMTCTIIPEESVPFAVLPGLGCCSFALICSQVNGSTRDVLKDLLYSRHILSYFHCRETIRFPHDNLDQ